ncbi:MAG: DUF192 domain-containing protein [Nanoarchaeota archaeon]|nr:DUF192 domain-containing protein [Nanoarchaeota archaeon]
MNIFHKNKILANKVKHCSNIFSNFKGLRFSKQLKEKHALILVAENESIIETMIDMLFVFFPIDVLWLDKNKRVVDIRRNVKPFTLIVIPKRPAKYIIELKKGMTNNINLGDELKF